MTDQTIEQMAERVTQARKETIQKVNDARRIKDMQERIKEVRSHTTALTIDNETHTKVKAFCEKYELKIAPLVKILINDFIDQVESEGITNAE